MYKKEKTPIRSLIRSQVQSTHNITTIQLLFASNGIIPGQPWSSKRLHSKNPARLGGTHGDKAII